MRNKLLILLGTILMATANVNAYAADDVERVGATPTAVPFNFLDHKTNTLKGIMIDIAEGVADKSGFEIEMISTPFSSLIPALQTDRIDFISSAFAVSDKRAEVVDFTQVVLEYGEGLVVSSDDETEYRSLEDLNGKTLGISIGTIYVDPVKEDYPDIKIKIYDSMNDMIRDTKQGRLDAAIGDGPSMAYQANAEGDGVRYATEYEHVMPTKIALAVKKGDKKRLDQLNKAIDELKAENAIEEIMEKWGIKN